MQNALRLFTRAVRPLALRSAGYFRPTQQRMHRQFHVDSALQFRRRLEAHQ
jgi:hypothetical protein